MGPAVMALGLEKTGKSAAAATPKKTTPARRGNFVMIHAPGASRTGAPPGGRSLGAVRAPVKRGAPRRREMTMLTRFTVVRARGLPALVTAPVVGSRQQPRSLQGPPSLAQHTGWAPGEGQIRGDAAFAPESAMMMMTMPASIPGTLRFGPEKLPDTHCSNRDSLGPWGSKGPRPR